MSGLDRVITILKESPNPITRKEVQEYCEISSSLTKRYLNRLKQEGMAHVADWYCADGRAFAPMWAYGSGDDVPAPAKDAVKKVIKKEPVETTKSRASRWNHLTIPKTECKTTFVNNCNPWK